MSKGMFRETHARSVVKAVSWRLVGTAVTTLLVYVVTGKLALSVAVGGVEFFSKIVLFWFHERVWDHLGFGRREVQPSVIWFTGLSGSGKSTVASWVSGELRRRGYRVEELDGDAVREIFPRTGFSKPDRDQHIRRVGFLASKLEENGVFVVASFVSPYEETRQFVRGLCRSFMEVYVNTPLQVCEQRDPKGLYAKARRGEIENFTGIDDPYEPPSRPEVVIDTGRISVEEAGMRVMTHLMQQGSLRH
jgi:adenylylsulfate kinase